MNVRDTAHFQLPLRVARFAVRRIVLLYVSVSVYRGLIMRIRFLWIPLLAVTAACLPVHAQFSAAGASTQSSSAMSIPQAQLMQPQDLKGLVAAQDAAKVPVVLQVGSHIFFNEAHILGAQYAGPGSQPAGLALLEKTVTSLPKDKLIVLYCGCCPWNRCPNVGPAFKRLHDLGYTNVKVLYLPNNFGDDWVSKGYPTQK
jgi:hypothetical protein